MISTYDIKQQQFSVFRVGNPNSKDVILIIGSCRSVPYLNYLNEYNKTIGEKYLIYFLDPFNFHWDESDKLTDMEAVINSLETDKNILEIFKSAKIFIHEYYANFGMFNCDKKAEKNIYQFGMNPEKDICIPNFHDCFILFNDFFNLDADFKLKAIADYNEIGNLSEETLENIYRQGKKNIDKFVSNCLKTDFPEMASEFHSSWQQERFFCSFNHISGNYSMFIFKLMNEKFLKFDLRHEFISKIEKLDLFGNTSTPLCEHDLFARNIVWNEEIVNFKQHNKL